MFGVMAVLNSKPAGAFRMRVIGEAETVMSPRLPSRIAMGPRVVQAGDVPLAALSAEMFVPPVAFVIVTAANEHVPIRDRRTTVIRNKWKYGRLWLFNPGKAIRPILPARIFLAEKARTLGFKGKRFDLSVVKRFQTNASPDQNSSLVSRRWTSQYCLALSKKNLALQS
jgi:hypothetical protein